MCGLFSLLGDLGPSGGGGVESFKLKWLLLSYRLGCVYVCVFDAIVRNFLFPQLKTV